MQFLKSSLWNFGIRQTNEFAKINMSKFFFNTIQLESDLRAIPTNNQSRH